MLKSNQSVAPGAIALDQLFAGATRTGSGEVVARSCVSDWRQVEPGDVYVALPDMGESNRDDGHDHAQRAVSHGAIAVVCEQPVPVFDVPTYLVPDSQVALGQLCQALIGNPSRTMPVIGVTGTHGKSTTIALLEAIFSHAGHHCGTLSSLGCYDGMTCSDGISDAPSSPALASRLANMAAAGCSHALVEISSQMLSRSQIAGVQLDAVCVTHVTEAHLDLHNSVKNYRETKRRILNYLVPGGMTILNADDPVSVGWLDRFQGPVLTYGLEGQGEITARIVERHANEQVFILTAGGESAAVRTTIVGDHHVANCLAAAALSLGYGIDLQKIAAGIEAVERLPSRMEPIDCGQGFPVYVDAADHPDALRASLRAARQIAQRRVICVLGNQKHDTAPYDYAISQVVRRMADLAIVARPLVDNFDNQDESQLDAYPDACVEVIADRGEAIACAVAVAEPGDVVVIVGSQPQPSWTFGTDHGAPSDAEIARQLLYARGDSIMRIAA